MPYAKSIEILSDTDSEEDRPQASTAAAPDLVPVVAGTSAPAAPDAEVDLSYRWKKRAAAEQAQSTTALGAATAGMKRKANQ